jgi:hypothetical protein
MSRKVIGKFPDYINNDSFEVIFLLLPTRFRPGFRAADLIQQGLP